MSSIFVQFFAFFGLYSQLVNATCRLKSGHSTNGQDLLDQLKPLYGATFTYNDEKYTYTMRICDGVQIDDKYQSNIVGVVQEEKEDKYISVGSINDTVIKGGSDWIMLTYTNGDSYHGHCSKEERQAHIMLVCDPYALKGEFKVLYEENEFSSNCFYLMELPSSVACSSSPSSGLSSGSIFLIVFFTIIGVYLIFGAIYKRCIYGSKGMDQIPNIGFWKTCGSLQADGCNYLCRCTGSGYNSNQPYEGVADDQLDDEIDDEHLLPM